jgi:hypothetical protein
MIKPGDKVRFGHSTGIVVDTSDSLYSQAYSRMFLIETGCAGAWNATGGDPSSYHRLLDSSKRYYWVYKFNCTLIKEEPMQHTRNDIRNKAYELMVQENKSALDTQFIINETFDTDYAVGSMYKLRNAGLKLRLKEDDVKLVVDIKIG